MAPWPEIVAGASSLVARFSTYVFLRWVGAFGQWQEQALTKSRYQDTTSRRLYSRLSRYTWPLFFGQSTAFGHHRPKLSEAFPKLFGKDKLETVNEEQDHTEPALYEDEKTFFKVLLVGIPNWRESEYSYLTIFINGLLALLTLDLVFRGPLLHPVQDLRFSRVGFVDQTSAKVLFREPDPSQLPVYAYLKASGSSTWSTTDRIYYLSSETDFTYPVTFSGLKSRDFIHILSLKRSIWHFHNFTTAILSLRQQPNLYHILMHQSQLSLSIVLQLAKDPRL